MSSIITLPFDRSNRPSPDGEDPQPRDSELERWRTPELTAFGEQLRALECAEGADVPAGPDKTRARPPA